MSLIDKARRHLLRLVRCSAFCAGGDKLDHEDRRINAHIVNLPTELLLLIFPLLPFPSQVCFALTCKHMYHLFGSVLDDERLDFPRVLSNKKFEISPDAPYILRAQVLILLEDHCWAYCSGCCKLHPRSEFRFRLSQEPNIRTCRHYAGIVYLCGCISLTFRHRKRLELWLETGFIDASRDFYGNRRIFQRLLDERGRPYLFHQCSIPGKVDAYIHLTMRLFVDKGFSLIVQTRYEVRLRNPSPLPDGRTELCIQQDREPVHICYKYLHVGLIEIIAYWAVQKYLVLAPSVEEVARLDRGRSTIVQSTRNLGACFSHRSARRSFYQINIKWSTLHRLNTGCN